MRRRATIVGTSAHLGASTAVTNVHEIIAFGSLGVIAEAARHVMRVEVLPRLLIDVFAVPRCGVGQHHPDGLVQLAAVDAYACVVTLPRTPVRGAHPAREFRAARFVQRVSAQGPEAG